MTYRDPVRRTDLADAQAAWAAAQRQALQRFRPQTPAGSPPDTAPDPRDLEQLRALGYVN